MTLKSTCLLTTRILDSAWDAAWDALAGSCPESGFMQSSAWMRFKTLEGYRTSRTGLFDDGGALVGGAVLLQYSGPDRGGLLLCPEGPVLDWKNPDRARGGLKAIVAQAQRLSNMSGDIGLRVEPHVCPPRSHLWRNWMRSPVDLTPLHTLVLNVRRSDQDLLAAMKPKARYNLHLSQRHGVQVSRSTDVSDLRTFYSLFEETARRGNFFAEPFSFFLNLGFSLFPTHTAELYIAEWQGEILAAILVVFFGRRATYLYGGSSRVHRDVMPTYALHWAAIQDARALGCAEYDFYGYDPFGHPEHLYAGISRFKRQWGAARRDHIGAYDYLFYDRLAEQVVERFAVEKRRA